MVEINVRKFWGLNPTFVGVTGEKLVRTNNRRNKFLLYINQGNKALERITVNTSDTFLEMNIKTMFDNTKMIIIITKQA